MGEKNRLPVKNLIMCTLLRVYYCSLDAPSSLFFNVECDELYVADQINAPLLVGHGS